MSRTHVINAVAHDSRMSYAFGSLANLDDNSGKAVNTLATRLQKNCNLNPKLIFRLGVQKVILFAGFFIFVGVWHSPANAEVPIIDPRTDSSEPPPPPEWRWRQVAASLRTQGRFTIVEVNPQNPRLIMIGTEEGTIVRSDDGGVTWIEIEPAPKAVQRFSLAPKTPGLPALGELVPPDYAMFVDPPGANWPERVWIPFDTLFFSIKPDFVAGGFMPKVTMPVLGFLTEATAQRAA
ncbi:MAG: hypothetical protein IPJ88_05775 [Myxococcales bacterium]|nr:MAG: hypothetical protein IPJ88_05775 [Myxococcales bacterium]